ncbi:MAG: hypothetical protein ACYC58_09150 [Pseudomonadaceae bacterium]
MKMDINILILDCDTTRTADLKTSLSSYFEGYSLDIHTHLAGEGDWNPTVASDSEPDLVLFHWSDAGALSNSNVYTPVNRAKLKLAYSGAGISTETTLPVDWLPIPRPLNSSADFSEHEWFEFFQWIIDSNRSPDYLPRALRADFPRISIAFLILTQGFLAMSSGEIHGAPTEQDRVWARDWWHLPFESIPDLDVRLGNELGLPSLPAHIRTLIQWSCADDSGAKQILDKWAATQAPRNDSSNSRDIFRMLIEKVNSDLTQRFG